MSNDLGTIKKIDLRERWKNEASDFTPWLAENIHHLNSAISEFGMNIQVEGTEENVGGYFADILATDTETGENIVIENQLEKTDHDHLGKAITYASHFNASTVIWIAAEFTKEHSRALDWLNRHTKKSGLEFYGIEIELLQTDDGKQNVRFNIVKKPRNTAVKHKVDKGSSVVDPKQSDFWERYYNKLEGTKRIPAERLLKKSPKPQCFYRVAAFGKPGIFLSNQCKISSGTLCVRVRVGGNASMFRFLESRKAEIESDLGKQLQWKFLKTESLIVLSHPSINLSDPAKVEEALNWLVEYTIKFWDVFSKVINEYQN
jgi:hypothetical protein